MSTDRELLERAAKAAGLDCRKDPPFIGLSIRSDAGYTYNWNPLDDDGDALRLAVKLGIGVYWAASYVHATQPSGVFFYESRETDDPYAATRRAIVRAAAAIGEKT